MRLKKIEITGFKSFKNKCTIEFPFKFTTIVGPNGSGKSNIVDAICFVLGKSRGLRSGGKLSDIIFNGGMKEPPSDKAVVSLYLENDGKEVKIMRSVDSKGRSIYRVDDKAATREKLIELIGENEYNILLQNDVTNVIEMTPRERRKIIDEVCGISEYDEKKEKAIKELSVVENKISETHILLDEKASYLKQLEKEKNDAVAFQGLSEELKRYEEMLLYKNFCSEEELIKKFDVLIAELKKEKELCVNEINQLNLDKSLLEKEISKINEDIITLEKKRIEKDSSGLAIEQHNLKNLKNRLDEINALIEKNINEKNNKKEILETLNSNKKEILLKIEKLNIEISRYTSDPIEKKIDALKDELYNLKYSEDVIRKENDALCVEVADAENKISDLSNKTDVLIKEEQKLAREIDSRMMEYKEKFELSRNKKRMSFDAEKEYEKTLKEYDKINAEYIRKSEVLKHIKEDSSFHLEKVIDGIYGRVSELCTIKDPKYSKAIYAAAGNRMNYIVVDNEDTAIKCINYLKASKEGKGTFLPLNKINAKVTKETIQLKNVLGYARDFIKTDSKFGKIFDFVLGDTIIVESVDDFKQIIGKYRAVSLDGDIAEKSGAMTGGFIKTTMNIDEIKTQLSEMKEKLENLSRVLTELDEKRKNYDESTNDKISALLVEIEKLKIEKNNLTSKREEISNEINEIREKTTEKKNKINELNEKISDIKKRKDFCVSNLEKLLARRKDAGLEFIEKLKDEKRNLEIELSGIEKDISIIEKAIEDLDIEKLQSELKIIEKNIDESNKKIIELKESAKQKEKEEKQTIEEISLLESKRKECEEKILKENIKINELNKKIESISTEIEKNLIEKTKSETRIIELKSKFKDIKEMDKLKTDENEKKLKEKINEVKEKLNSMGNVNLKAIETYNELKAQFDIISEKVETLKKEKQSIYDFMAAVEKRKRETFIQAFETIKKNFEQTFNKLTEGYGTLILDNPKEISESGLLINASPKKKKILSIDSMSGGEKVLTSASFLMAIQQYKKSPFYIVDEVDAALDRENSVKLAQMLKDSESQFILITHREDIIKYADAAIGVSMNDGISKIVGVKLSGTQEKELNQEKKEQANIIK